MRPMSVQILDWAARAPGREHKAQWYEWAGAAMVSGDAASSAVAMRPLDMPMMLRRRAGRIGQLALAACYEVDASSQARYIFCSRHGDFRRTAGLLHAVVAREPLSPAEFSVSVHNALAGLLSIATRANAGHTAIAAGPDSFASGLIEAAATLADAPDLPVLLVYYDEPLPAPYDELVVEGGEALAIALALGAVPASRDGGRVIEITAERGQGSATSTTGVALDFLRFLMTGHAGRAHGERIDLEWRRAG
jgi:hypothetical protein